MAARPIRSRDICSRKWKLDAKSDVTLIEVPNSAIPAAVRGRQAVIGNSTEPMITQGIRNGLWSEPFFNVPKELGPYAYSTINVRLDSIQKEPEVVRGFVRGMMKGLKFLYANPHESAEVAKKQFPTMPLDDLKATLDRSFTDEMWSKDGMISKEAWETGKRRGARGRHPQDRRQIRRDHRHELRRKRAREPVRLRPAGIEERSREESEPTCLNRSGTSFSPTATRRCSGSSGYGARGGFGKRPALLIIDVNYAFCDERPDADPRIDQALAQFLRRGRLGRHAVSQVADRQGARQGHPGDLHDRRAARGQLGQRQLELEERPLRRGHRQQAGDQRRRQRDRRRDRTGAAGHRRI